MADFSKMNYKELIQQSKELRAEEEARLAILRENNNVSAQELQEIIKKDAVLQNIKVKQADAVKYLKIQRDTQKVITDDLVRQEASLKSISAELAPIAALDRKRLDLQKAQSNISVEVAESYNSIAEKSQQLAALTKEDSVGRAILKEQIDAEIKDLESKGGIDKEILENLKEQRKLADNISSLSAEERDILTEQIRAYDSMKKTIRGTLDTIRMTLQTPQAMIVGASVAAGKFVGAMADVNRQTGMFMASTAGLSFVFDDAAGTLSQMAKLSGDVNKATFMAQLNTNVLATSMGIGGEEAATLVNAFGNLSGQSMETGENMVSAMGATARMKGVLPSQAMKDMAAATEAMAVYSKGTGENFANAAIQAAQLGISVADTSKMADTLLDFETSIEKELEASAMLGKNINLQRARELAYAGDLEGMTKEILNQVGEFPDDPYQQKALADALGIGVAELKQMVANQENLNTSTGKLEQTYGMVNDYMRAIGDKFGGPIASGVTFFVGELIRAKLTAMAMNGTSMFGGLGETFGKLGDKFKSIFSGAGGATDAVEKSISEKATETIQDKASEKAEDFVDNKMDSVVNPEEATTSINSDRTMGDKLKDLAKGLKAMGNAKVLFGALNLIPTAIGFAAMVVGIPSLIAIGAFGTNAGLGLTELGKGLSKMGSGKALMGSIVLLLAATGFALMTAGIIGLAGIALLGAAAGGGLIALGAGLASFGATAGTVGWLGVAVILALAGAFTLFTFGLSLLAPLVQAIGNVIVGVIGAIAGGISAIIGSITTMMATLLPLLNVESALGVIGLAAGFMSLSFALMMFAQAGIMALPALAAVGAFAAVGGGDLMTNLLGGGKEEGGVIDEIKGLRADLNAGKIAVYMDGSLVTSKVANVASKNPVT